MDDELKYSNNSMIEFYISLICLFLLYSILFGEPGYSTGILNEFQEYNFPSNPVLNNLQLSDLSDGSGISEDPVSSSEENKNKSEEIIYSEDKIHN